MYDVLDTFFFTQKHTFSPDHKLGGLQNTLRNALYIVHFWKKVVISFERGDIDVRPSYNKSLLFFDFFRCIQRFAYFFGSFVVAGTLDMQKY